MPVVCPAQMRDVQRLYHTLYPETAAGGFSRRSGSIMFYARVNSLLTPGSVVLDYGAGRGLQAESPIPFVRQLADLRGKAARVIGVDPDPVVLDNPLLDEARMMADGTIPADTASIDLILADHVLEHIAEPDLVAREFDRVLRPGGWICARTPSGSSLIALAARVVPNRFHPKAIAQAQPGEREAADVFPTFYRMNSERVLQRLFPPTRWLHCTHGWDGEPNYHFGSIALARVLQLLQTLKPGGEKLFVFIQKR